ncbi:MAG: ABC transporter permease [Bacteroidales bacterium]
MFNNFIKVAFRIFFRDRFQTLINILGLAIGLAFSIIIFLYAHKEFNYDRFHRNADRIYRIAVNGRIADNTFNHAVTPAHLAKTAASEISGIETTLRIARFGAWLIRYKDIRFNEDSLIFADSSFFHVFSFPLIRGNADDVLKKPNSIVISQATALRYFGAEDPVGKMLRIENDSTYYEVTGIMHDIPENSHIHFDMVGALSTFEKMLEDSRWVSHFLYTYVLVKPGMTSGELKAGLDGIVLKYVMPDYENFLNINRQQLPKEQAKYNYIPQPLRDIHLRSDYTSELEPAGKILNIYLFTVLAISILVLACMNFISLVTARSILRAKEVGIRKIVGSGRSGLVNQFLLESSLLAFLAMALALLLTELSLPPFNRYIGLHLSLRQLLNPAGLSLVAALILVIGLISGLYPALVLSSFNPLAFLHKRFYKENDKGHLRSLLTYFQLFVAVGTISMTLIISGQLRFLIHKERGYNTKDIVVIRRPDGLGKNLEEYKRQILTHPGVLAVTNTNSAMGGNFARLPYVLEGSSAEKNYSANNLFVSYGFDSTYETKMFSGRFFMRQTPEDSSACVINETFASMLGIKDPVGKYLKQLSPYHHKDGKFKIIGVVSDFHFETLENPIRPLVMVLMPGNMEGYLSVRLTPDRQDSTILFLNRVWDSFTSAYPFVYYNLDQDRRNKYEAVNQTKKIFLLLSLVAILLAGLGLFALFSFLYSRRQREIGIQKAMGVSNSSLLLHRAQQVAAMVTISSVLAWIGACFLATAWFNDYAYHINLNVLYFLAAMAIVLIISLATAYYHAFLATRIDPGTALKHE